MTNDPASLDAEIAAYNAERDELIAEEKILRHGTCSLPQRDLV